MTTTELADELREMDDSTLASSGLLWVGLAREAMDKMGVAKSDGAWTGWAEYAAHACRCLDRADAISSELDRRDAERN